MRFNCWKTCKKITISQFNILVREILVTVAHSRNTKGIRTLKGCA